MTFRYLCYLWRSDLHRYTGRTSAGLFLKNLLLNVGYKYSFLLRLCAYVAEVRPRALGWCLLVPLRLLFRHYQIKYALEIGYRTRIGPGLYIGHHMGIVVNERTVIGRNCNISHGVTLGVANRGPRRGVPVLGDNVYIGPGAKIIGAVRVGNNVAIGANCVVTHDVPDGAVVVGVPGKVISNNGSEGYVINTDYGPPPGQAGEHV